MMTHENARKHLRPEDYNMRSLGLERFNVAWILRLVHQHISETFSPRCHDELNQLYENEFSVDQLDPSYPPSRAYANLRCYTQLSAVNKYSRDAKLYNFRS
jgi:hypothetical protein